MRICYFWFTDWPAARTALPPGALVPWTGPDPGGYWRVFSQQWASGEDLVTIEQDVLIHGQVMRQFAACPAPWCAFGWPVGPGQVSYWWLGCAKFSAALQAAVPVDALCRPVTGGGCLDGNCGQVPCHRHLDVIFQPL